MLSSLVLSEQLFRIDPRIRYVAVNQYGLIVELVQNPADPTNNSEETDRLEELIVNPIILEITRRRGQLDIGSSRYVVIRYGLQYQLILPHENGHVSLGLEPTADPITIAERVSRYLAAQVEQQRSRGMSQA